MSTEPEARKRATGPRPRASARPETPFENVQAAHEYVVLLVDAVRQARQEVAQDLEAARAEGSVRGEEALQVVALKLKTLEGRLVESRRLLNDLRRLRRVLLGEAEDAGEDSEADDPFTDA
jgi:hypothetical protein